MPYVINMQYNSLFLQHNRLQNCLKKIVILTVFSHMLNVYQVSRNFFTDEHNSKTTFSNCFRVSVASRLWQWLAEVSNHGVNIFKKLNLSCRVLTAEASPPLLAEDVLPENMAYIKYVTICQATTGLTKSYLVTYLQISIWFVITIVWAQRIIERQIR